jgi:hypothetical protein
MCDARITLGAVANTVKGRPHSISEDDDVCWICHDGNSVENPLETPCKCKMKAHRHCLSRWQLQKAGSKEERHCRFCKTELPDWRDTHSSLPKSNPIMTVIHQGQTYQVQVKPGEAGKVEFDRTIREIFGLNDGDDIQLTFGCKVPGSSAELTLEGWEAFDAAVHCASISAGLRSGNTPSPRKQQQGGGIGVDEALSASPLKAIRRLFTRS